MSPLPPPSRPRPGGVPNRPALAANPANPIYVTVDVEATANERHDEIIEVAAVTFTSERILDRWTTLVRPVRPVPLGTSQLTGITNAMLQAAPPFASVAPQLRAFVKNYPIVGQSVDFDLKRLVAHGLALENPTYDTYELATLLLPDLPVYSLTRIAERLQVGTPQEHRALGDCELTAAVFRALLDKIAECDMETLGELSRLADLGQSPFARLFRQAQREKQQGTFGGGAGASILQQLRAQAGGGQAEKEGGVDLLYLMPRPRPEPLRNTGSQKALDTRAILDTFRPDGPFAEAFPHYEHRPQQMEMLDAVAEAFNKDETLLVEAGTGTGKSVAYLVPAVAHAVEHGETVVVSTATIALQDQLAKKDIPDLQDVLATIGGAPAPNGAGLPAEFRATVVKGRANYLVPLSLVQIARQPRPLARRGAADAPPPALAPVYRYRRHRRNPLHGRRAAHRRHAGVEPRQCRAGQLPLVVRLPEARAVLRPAGAAGGGERACRDRQPRPPALGHDDEQWRPAALRALDRR